VFCAAKLAAASFYTASADSRPLSLSPHPSPATLAGSPPSREAASTLEIDLCQSLQGFTLVPRAAADSYCLFPRFNQHFAVPSSSARARNS
jgi:hypothetical protein